MIDLTIQKSRRRKFPPALISRKGHKNNANYDHDYHGSGVHSFEHDCMARDSQNRRNDHFCLVHGSSVFHRLVGVANPDRRNGSSPRP